MDPRCGARTGRTSTTPTSRPRCRRRRKYGGAGSGRATAGPAEQKLDKEPWLKRIFAGYAFAIDYRDRRGHAYALFDQEQTRRVTEKQQPGACIQCHASNLALYRFAGKGDVQKGFERVSAMPYDEARNMKDDAGPAARRAPGRVRRLPRPGDDGAAGDPARASSPGSRRSRRSQGVADYDPNRDATPPGDARRSSAASATSSTTSRGRGKVVTYPWANGLRSTRSRPTTTRRASPTGCTRRPGTQVLKAQHPGVRGLEPGRARARRRRVRRLPHALPARRARSR